MSSTNLCPSFGFTSGALMRTSGDDSDKRHWTWLRVAGIIVVLAPFFVAPFFLVSYLVSDSKPSPRLANSITTSTKPTETTTDSSVSETVGQLSPLPPTTQDLTTATGSVTTQTVTTETGTAETATEATAVVGSGGANGGATTTQVLGASTTSPQTQRPTYPTLPDGTPAPVVAIFDLSTITLTGMVPSQAAVDRLSALALANSQTPATVVNYLTVNPSVPISIGVRVIELNSVRFPTASAVVMPEHAKELDRVANVMRALPNISVLVIGHADQRGTEAANFAISDARARSVVNYLVYVGISASRLSSRAVGATDLLVTGNEETSLALNRRTEFVFYGLLIQ